MNTKASIFEVVYLAIAVTTFRHTAWAAATVFEGQRPETVSAHMSLDSWWITGILMAIAIDVGMFVVAWFLVDTRQKVTLWVLSFAFALLAISSFYMQILYAVSHSQEFTFSDGVTLAWQERLQPLVDARIVLMPLMLPLFAVIYTLSAITQYRAKPMMRPVSQVTIENNPPPEAVLALPETIDSRVELFYDSEGRIGFKCLLCGFEHDHYKNEVTRKAAIKSHMTRTHPELVTWR